MKKILSVLMSATLGLSMTVPMISYAENAELTNTDLSEPIPPEALPYSVSDSGDSVSFDGNQNYDYIVSTNSKFTTERTDSSFKFTPKENGSFIVSRLWLDELIIDYNMDYDVAISMGTDNLSTCCHYFYPHIQNFEITYNSKTGMEVEFLGETVSSNAQTIEKIQSGEMGICYDFIEKETDDIFDYVCYYTFASCHLLGSDIGAFFIYFDYGCDNKKDKSLFCVDSGHYGEEYSNYIDVSGNAEITKVLKGASWIDNNLEIATCDMVPYTIIEPTSDGFVEIYCPDVFPMSSMILEVSNGKFIPSYTTIGCVMPEECDLNMDGYINISDAVIFQKYMLGQTKLINIQRSCSDLNYDGSIDIFDMVLLRQRVIEDNHSGLIPEPVDAINYSEQECGKNPELS